MIRAFFAAAASLCGIFVAIAATSGEPVDNPADSGFVTVECELSDGTWVRGHLENATASLPFLTQFGRMDPPFRSIRRISVAEDREGTTLELENGDRLTGFVDADGLAIITSRKPARVKFPKLRRCGVKVVPVLPLSVVSASGSGSWNGHVPAHAVDGDETTFWNGGDWKAWIEADLGEPQSVARIEFSLLFSPDGHARYDVYASDAPIGASRKDARLVGTIAGGRRDGDVVTMDCPRGLKARYVQISAAESVSWFAIREIRILPSSKSNGQ